MLRLTRELSDPCNFLFKIFTGNLAVVYLSIL